MSSNILRGIPNLHSHAFQRAMAGMAEKRLHPTDSFWTWRETMYELAGKFTPEDLYHVARLLYLEMLQAGYTSVCEFHYLHHAPDGQPYANSTVMSEALIEAAKSTGIALTLLPVVYLTADLEGRPLGERQKRFGHTVDTYLRDWQVLNARSKTEGFKLGCALHSLRAVPLDAMTGILAGLPKQTPIHIHIAEQAAEVEDCVRTRGARPVEWLLEHADVDASWSLVHATHLNDTEVSDIAKSNATVVICPTTEANLGDGIFRAMQYFEQGGRWGIGSDSHISVSPVEELRWLEYANRLQFQQRTVLANANQTNVAVALLDAIAESAGTATGRDEQELQTHQIELDLNAPTLTGARDQGEVASRWIFSGNRNLIKCVAINGQSVIVDGRHALQDDIHRDYQRTLKRLLG